MIPPLIFGPIPPYNNPPIESQFYKPSQFFISGIITGVTTLVTTSVDQNYVIGQLCRLLIPNGYGCREINEQLGYVISIPSPNQVELNINSQNVSQYINANLRNIPQIIAVGDTRSGAINDNGPLHYHTHIPGSFRNISPF